MTSWSTGTGTVRGTVSYKNSDTAAETQITRENGDFKEESEINGKVYICLHNVHNFEVKKLKHSAGKCVEWRAGVRP